MCLSSPGDQGAEMNIMWNSEVFRLSPISSTRKLAADRGLEDLSPENADATVKDAKGGHLAILHEHVE